MTAAIALVALGLVAAFAFAAIVRADRAGSSAAAAERANTELVAHERDDLAERLVELEEGIAEARALAAAGQRAAVEAAQEKIDDIIRRSKEGVASDVLEDARRRRAARRAGAGGVPAVPAEGVPELPAASAGAGREGAAAPTVLPGP